ncbi:hypothetical protein N7465_008198 [Penicillium sp. CMV-2018d]|nr:hypothetical protein N7465_008198 [Penicillium sp. CMV-2018d]
MHEDKTSTRSSSKPNTPRLTIPPKKNATEDAIPSSAEDAEPTSSGTNIPQTIRDSSDPKAGQQHDRDNEALTIPSSLSPIVEANSTITRGRLPTNEEQPIETEIIECHGRGPGTC